MCRRLAIIPAALSLALASCSSDVTGVPTDIARACDAANDGKVLEITGYADAGRSVYCSNTGGGPVRCGFDFKESAGSPRKMGIDIKQGSGANSVEKLPKSYKKSDIRIYDHGGKLLESSSRLKVTGKLSATPDGKVCFITAAKIEKQ